MIHTTQDFFNKVALEIKQRFFVNEIHGKTKNQYYYKANKAIEDFNNGCLAYRTFISRLAKSCQSNNATIHNIVEKYVISFGAYQYKPGSKNKV
jgi:hypothetical protein